VGVVLSGLLTVGLLPLLVRVGLPLLVLPFVATLLTVLLAMRQRVRDGAPKAVDFLLGTPEENLAYLRTRLARFGSHYIVRFHAPFLGRWTVTQGVDGRESHFGPWRQALDFEVMGEDGRAFRGAGTRLEEFHCYKLPVLATADGTVVQVVDGVPDNAVGETNLKENWGNLVMLHHGLGVYSMVCHLSPGSIKVALGQVVRRGDELGACGASGRSPVPHVHFQIQATGRIGAPTLLVELHDVVAVRQDSEVLLGTWTPAKGDVVRNIEVEPDLERLLRLPYGEALEFRRDGEEAAERVVPDIDLYGNVLLRSGRGGVLYYDLEGGLFTVYDALGPSASVLHLLHAALGRVPLDGHPGLTWRDHVRPKLVTSPLVRPLLDLVSPFLRRTGTEMRYAVRRESGAVVVEGRSVRVDRSGAPLVSTSATLRRGKGIVAVEVTARGRTHRAVRVEADAA
jgi:murein DD-endopeptidase MepM/ murein hydrolase activator NlpD